MPIPTIPELMTTMSDINNALTHDFVESFLKTGPANLMVDILTIGNQAIPFIQLISHNDPSVIESSESQSELNAISSSLENLVNGLQNISFPTVYVTNYQQLFALNITLKQQIANIPFLAIPSTTTAETLGSTIASINAPLAATGLKQACNLTPPTTTQII